MFEAEFFYVEALCEGVDEPDGVLFIYVSVDGIWEEHCLISGGSVYVVAHGGLFVQSRFNFDGYMQENADFSHSLLYK